MKGFLFGFKIVNGQPRYLKHGYDWSVSIDGIHYLFRYKTGKEFSCISWQEGRQAIQEGWIS